MRVRPLRREDRSDVERLLLSTGMFSAVEIATALELVDAAITSAESSGYFVFVLDLSNDPATRDVRGYVCFGPTPLTDGTYDLYWIAVERSAQG
ncbi:MAG: GNAT family N-acetyltransferase, partial [Gemmatimonadaceae bacterium]